MILSTSGWSADNFEFSIQGESGLEFVITGYATDGAQIFRRETSQLEKNNIGMPSYIVRVDRSDLERKGFAEWCVQDLTGRWKLLPKDDPKISLCATAPTFLTKKIILHVVGVFVHDDEHIPRIRVASRIVISFPSI